MRNGPLTTAVAAALLLTAACGGSPTAEPGGGSGGGDTVAIDAQSVYDRINAMSGAERTAELVRLAEEEGELNVYTSNSDIDKVIEGFEDEYDISVSAYRANSETVLQRMLQEQDAGFDGNDVVDNNAIELNVLNKEGLLAPYEGELRDRVRPEGQQDGWTASYFNAFVVGWNTDLVKPGEEPTTIEELADPRWKGKVSFELGDYDWFAGLYQYYEGKGWAQEQILEFFRGLAANAKVVKGHTVQGELLTAGQFEVALSLYSHTVDKAADKGAPVAWRPVSGEPVQPVVLRPNGIAMMKAAQNPAAAMLFVDWQLSQGQDVFADVFRIGSVAGADDPLEGLEVVPVPTDELLAEPEKWSGLYAELLEGRETAG